MARSSGVGSGMADMVFLQVGVNVDGASVDVAAAGAVGATVGEFQGDVAGDRVGGDALPALAPLAEAAVGAKPAEVEELSLAHGCIPGSVRQGCRCGPRWPCPARPERGDRASRE